MLSPVGDHLEFNTLYLTNSVYVYVYCIMYTTHTFYVTQDFMASVCPYIVSIYYAI
jgi:hypothetical protein